MCQHPAVRGRLVAGAVVVAGVLVSACGGSPGGTSAAAPAASGKDLYVQKCAECHGANLEGTAKGPSHLSRIYEPSHHSDESFRRAITSGSPQHHWNFGPMKPVTGLSDADITAIIAFVRAQQNERGFQG
jgi:mono/diheme cytochrome c family protein